MISATEVAKVGVFREMTNIRKEISEKLDISVHTVNRYRQNIPEKTNADNIVKAIAFAKRMRVIG